MAQRRCTVESQSKTKTIDTLIADINTLLVNGIPPDTDPSVIEKFGQALAQKISERLVREKREATLRMSNIGQPCERKLYYELNSPEDGEKLRPETYLKFLYGDILEELMLFLTVLAGHKVEGTQDEQEIEGIKGHRDAVIDGVVTDVKSAAPYSFKKFEDDLLSEDDPFGYLPQLQSYLHAGQTDDTVTDKDRAAFLVVDKTLGHICLNVQKRDEQNYPEIYKRKKEIIAGGLPPRGFEDKPEGQSGNRALGLNCSYCAFKHKCWENLRTFHYYNGPKHLTKVVREPNVPELK